MTVEEQIASVCHDLLRVPYDFDQEPIFTHPYREVWERKNGEAVYFGRLL